MLGKEKKGTLLTLESFIAAFIVITVLAFLYSEPIQVPKFQENVIERTNYHCLKNLELSNKLRTKVREGNRTGIVKELKSCINLQVGYNVTLCGWSGCDDVKLPGNKSIVSSSYWVAGKGTGYFPTQVKIYGWAK